MEVEGYIVYVQKVTFTEVSVEDKIRKQLILDLRLVEPANRSLVPGLSTLLTTCSKRFFRGCSFSVRVSRKRPERSLC